MDDVADVIGLNKATVYHYYASKSLILFDIYRQAAEGTLAAVHDDPSWTAREALYQYTVRLLTGIAANPERAAVYFQEQPYITEWFTSEQVAEVREKEAQVYEHVHGLIDRGIASGEFYECDSHVLALGYIGMTLGSYRWLRPSGRRTAKEIAAEFSTALLRGLIRDESVRDDFSARACSSGLRRDGSLKIGGMIVQDVRRPRRLSVDSSRHLRLAEVEVQVPGPWTGPTGRWSGSTSGPQNPASTPISTAAA